MLLCYHVFPDLVMIGVIVVSHRLHMNPDNLATPVAASIGDVVSISLLAHIASAFYHIHGEWNNVDEICLELTEF
jgi:cation transporter-like permease